jgi:site-specific recombinase XerD
VADFNNPAKEPSEFQPSIHVRKSRVRTFRQFFHFLTLHRIVAENIAAALPYPKIEKTVPQFSQPMNTISLSTISVVSSSAHLVL